MEMHDPPVDFLLRKDRTDDFSDGSFWPRSNCDRFRIRQIQSEDDASFQADVSPGEWRYVIGDVDKLFEEINRI